jgi:hypothetical protein
MHCGNGGQLPSGSPSARSASSLERRGVCVCGGAWARATIERCWPRSLKTGEVGGVRCRAPAVGGGEGGELLSDAQAAGACTRFLQ